MKIFVIAALGAVLVDARPAIAQDRPWKSSEQVAAIPRAELDAITERGRRMLAYNRAAWMATDAVRPSNPRLELLGAYVARERDDGRWEVVFGKLERDAFRIAFRAEETERHSGAYRTFEMRPPAADTGYFLRAVRALDTCTRDFGTVRQQYNPMVMRVQGSEDWHVYLLPWQSGSGAWIHGGDARYRVSPDGRTILERRRMHNAIIDGTSPPQRDGAKLVTGYHTAVLDDRPEDSDVFYVLTREPRLPEYIASRSYYFAIDTLGRIMAYNRDTTIKR